MASTPGGLGSYVPAPTPGTAETPGAAFAGAGREGVVHDAVARCINVSARSAGMV
jgi:hypothetical protein